MATAIRLATLGDLPTLRTFWRAYLEEARPTYPVDMLGSIDTFTRHLAMALTADPPLVTCLLASDGDEPIGFCMYETQQRVYGEPQRIGFVHYVYVVPRHREHGVANQLLLLAAEHAIAQGLAYAEMTVVAGDTQWEKLGWVPYETRYFVPLPTALAALQQRELATRGNGLDREEVAAPSDAPAPLALVPDDD
jgi:GNAT superfamily N-acetyltransferase